MDVKVEVKEELEEYDQRYVASQLSTEVHLPEFKDEPDKYSLQIGNKNDSEEEHKMKIPSFLKEEESIRQHSEEVTVNGNTKIQTRKGSYLCKFILVRDLISVMFVLRSLSKKEVSIDIVTNQPLVWRLCKGCWNLGITTHRHHMAFREIGTYMALVTLYSKNHPTRHIGTLSYYSPGPFTLVAMFIFMSSDV
ncbi:uncharacterized protein LOC114336318 isoform X2 [Diabrotica virgifera virgifera]|uniref:Uncharacterized protein n=2 Tax=Diabrotica virgifera virgifera TaxID=50390 RepID=A0ABM5IUH8_DIAVI|nr:uncharacterized protein LOC114336318 isoform X2 [Diabrotica virgifera virgifera]